MMIHQMVGGGAGGRMGKGNTVPIKAHDDPPI